MEDFKTDSSIVFCGGTPIVTFNTYQYHNFPHIFLNKERGAYMRKFESLRKMVCLLLIWNVILTTSLVVFANMKNEEEKVTTQICNEELIPLEIIEDME